MGQLNEAVIQGSISEIIRIAEGFHERKIVAIADEIYERQPDTRIVLVAGPEVKIRLDRRWKAGSRPRRRS